MSATSPTTVDPRDLRALRQELRAAGVFDRHELPTWLELGALLSLFAAITVGVATLAWGWALLLVPAAAFVMSSAVMLGHEGGHRALSASRFRNDLMLQLTFTLIGGMSARYWKHKHNMLHHGHPNVVHTDQDLDLWPMAASRSHHERSGPVARWFQRHLQGYAFWPMTALLSVSMHVESFRHLYNEARAGKLGAGFWVDVACLVGHYTLWLVIPSLAFGLLPAFAFFAAIWGLVGMALSAIFAPAHHGLPIVDGFEDNWVHQLRTTRNLAMPRWLAWFFMGLDRQVEHHLFPRIAHRQLPRATPIVKAWCARHGLPHHTIAYGAGLAEVTRLMHGAWDAPVAVAGPLAI